MRGPTEMERCRRFFRGLKKLMWRRAKNVLAMAEVRQMISPGVLQSVFVSIELAGEEGIGSIVGLVFEERDHRVRMFLRM